MRFGLQAKIFLAFLILSLTPLIVSGIYVVFNAGKMEREILSHTTAQLDEEARNRLEREARQVAAAVSSFLLQCKNDVDALTMIPPSDAAYTRFALVHKRDVMVRVRSGDSIGMKTIEVPLYKEIAFVNLDGKELVRIADGTPAPKRVLRDSSSTTYRREHYFDIAKRLPRNDMYVSHVTGWHVGKAEQLGAAASPEAAIEGRQYEGVVRFAQPMYDSKDTRIGIVVASLDHRHLMEFTQHLDPLSNDPVPFPVYDSGNYAFMFDDEGWIITHPKYWDIRGVDSSGALVPPYSELSSPEQVREGRIPFNLFYAGFVHPSYPEVAKEVLLKHAGSVGVVNIGRTEKVMAYAPILFNYGQYRKSGVFGGITIGAQAQVFHKPARATTSAIDKIVSLSLSSTYVMLVAAALGAFLLSLWFSRRITKPINTVIAGVHSLADGTRNIRIQSDSEDEIGALASSVNRLAAELEDKEHELSLSFSRLKESKQEVENHAKELEHRLMLIEKIHTISDLLGTTFDLREILHLILRSSVDGLGFDRATLFLLDESRQKLEFQDSVGFTPQQEVLLRRSPFIIAEHDAVETRVLKSKKLIYVENIQTYREATPLDFVIRQEMKSRAFAYAPLMVQEDTIGILGVGKLATDVAITGPELHSLQILADNAARVIEMSRLYREISEERASLNSILQSMLAGIVTVDDEGKIKSLNPAAERILGVSQASVAGLPMSAAFDDDPSFAEALQNMWDLEKQYPGFELEFRRRGEPKTLFVTSSPLWSPSRQNAGFILVIQDVTEKKQFDDHVVRMERLASMGRLAAGVAHEIRNPLTGLSLLLDDLHDSSPGNPENQSRIRGGLAVVERIDKLVTQLLAHASPKHEVKEFVDINDLIDKIATLLHNQITKSNIRLTLDLNRQIRAIDADPNRLSQAFLNIFLNAIQAMREGGCLTVSTTEVGNDLLEMYSNDQNAASSIIIRIADTGTGIPADARGRIFEPFFTTKQGGTGLGLYVTHQIIADHNGEVFVSENEGGGTVFSIFLPGNNRRIS